MRILRIKRMRVGARVFLADTALWGYVGATERNNPLVFVAWENGATMNGTEEWIDRSRLRME